MIKLNLYHSWGNVEYYPIGTAQEIYDLLVKKGVEVVEADDWITPALTEYYNGYPEYEYDVWNYKNLNIGVNYTGQYDVGLELAKRRATINKESKDRDPIWYNRVDYDKGATDGLFWFLFKSGFVDDDHAIVAQDGVVLVVRDFKERLGSDVLICRTAYGDREYHLDDYEEMCIVLDPATLKVVKWHDGQYVYIPESPVVKFRVDDSVATKNSIFFRRKK